MEDLGLRVLDREELEAANLAGKPRGPKTGFLLRDLSYHKGSLKGAIRGSTVNNMIFLIMVT